jgi:hypothetical protein
MEFLLNRDGRRVDFKETQGLFNRNASPHRYLLIWTVRSGSVGSDLIWDGSNLVRQLRILWLGLKMRPNQYLPIRTLGSRSGGSDLLWHDLILTVRLESYGSGKMGARGGGAVAGIQFPRRRLADLADLGRPGSILDEVWPGRYRTTRRTHLDTRDGGLGFGSGLPTTGMALALGGEGNSLAQTKKGGEKGARRVPYHPRKLRRWLEVEGRRCRG